MEMRMDSLNLKLQQLQHAILKVVQKINSETCLVHTIRVVDGYIYCYTEDEMERKTSPFRVQLKYVDKAHGEYLIVDGSATSCLIPLPRQNTIAVNKVRSTFKIRINKAQYFQKEKSNSVRNILTRKAVWDFRNERRASLKAS